MTSFSFLHYLNWSFSPKFLLRSFGFSGNRIHKTSMVFTNQRFLLSLNLHPVTNEKFLENVSKISQSRISNVQSVHKILEGIFVLYVIVETIWKFSGFWISFCSRQRFIWEKTIVWNLGICQSITSAVSFLQFNLSSWFWSVASIM